MSTGLRPFFSYYGSKWRIAKHYPAPEFASVVEPFAGSAGYATRHHTKKVMLVDSNPIIVGVWQYLLRTSAREILRLPAPVDSVDELKHAPEEAKWLVGFWLGRACSGPRRTLSAWGRTRKWPMCFWGTSIRERVARQVDCIRHWKIREGDYADLKTTKERTWFVDPPYSRQGKYYNGEALDYRVLGSWCRKLRGQVMVCENEGARWLPFKPFRVVPANSSRGKGRVSREAVWSRRRAAG